MIDGGSSAHNRENTGRQQITKDVARTRQNHLRQSITNPQCIHWNQFAVRFTPVLSRRPSVILNSHGVSRRLCARNITIGRYSHLFPPQCEISGLTMHFREDPPFTFTIKKTLVFPDLLILGVNPELGAALINWRRIFQNRLGGPTGVREFNSSRLHRERRCFSAVS